MSRRSASNWIADPSDTTRLVDYFYRIRASIGQGGNWAKAELNGAAQHLASFGPPKASAVKTADACATHWGRLRSLHDDILKAKHHTYPGASGFTWTDEGGFNIKEADLDAWEAFIKTHGQFKPFANAGWPLWDKVHEILPSGAQGQYIFNAASAQMADTGLVCSSQSKNDEEQSQTSSSSSQLISDWSQTNFGDSQPANGTDPEPTASQPTTHSSSQPTTVPATPTPVSQPTTVPATPVPATPMPAAKRTASDDDEAPWSSKRRKVSGPEAISQLSRSVDSIGNVLRDCFMPKSSSRCLPPRRSLLLGSF
ncbi:hypothetical protein C8J57DRAFT_1262076 [Mycena rebaudengoi]|nr:hypothetical protein C8J57DRAFT_1262076 [Mycena rebaudengoi]